MDGWKDRPKYHTYKLQAKVLKKKHDDMGISAKAVDILNGMVYNWLHMIASQAGELVRKDNKKTISSRDIQTSVRLTLPCELNKHAVSAGTRSVTLYSTSCYVADDDYHQKHSSADLPSLGKKKKKERRSTAKRHGILFPAGRIKTFMKIGRYAPRIGSGAPIYFAGVIEFLVGEVLHVAVDAARDNKKARITARHLLLAIKADDELNDLIFEGNIQNGGGGIISGGGTFPNINPFLIKDKCSKKDGKD